MGYYRAWFGHWQVLTNVSCSNIFWQMLVIRISLTNKIPFYLVGTTLLQYYCNHMLFHYNVVGDFSYCLFYLLGLCLCTVQFQVEGLCELYCYSLILWWWWLKRGVWIIVVSEQQWVPCFSHIHSVLPLSYMMEPKSMHKESSLGALGLADTT